MNIQCAICQDVLEPSNDIFITPCGHVFHFPCLVQWLEKSQTCPQCRAKVKRDGVTRIYFNFANTEAVKEDSFTLQQKLDSLSFQVKLKETENKNFKSELHTLKKQNSSLREEVKKRESEVKKQISAIHALKDQTAHFRSQCQDYDNVCREKERLQKKIDTYENIKQLICSTSNEVEELLQRNVDHKQLCTYIAILKGEMTICLAKRKEMRNKIHALQHELQTVKTEKVSLVEDFQKKIERLEEELAINRSENLELTRKLDRKNQETKDNEKVIVHNVSLDSIESPDYRALPSCSTKSSSKRDNSFLDESPTRASKKLKFFNNKDDSDLIIVSSNLKGMKENSPYLPTKSKSVLGLKDRDTQRGSRTSVSNRMFMSSKKFETAQKGTLSKDSTTVFDGFGGHSKTDTFPTAKTFTLKRSASSDLSKTKKVKTDQSVSSNKQLDGFVIKLT
ncbi:hypothetical protein TKK_0008671 [Trichogramma kaykai]